jgi:hypothetical protein
MANDFPEPADLATRHYAVDVTISLTDFSWRKLNELACCVYDSAPDRVDRAVFVPAFD